MPVRLNSTGGGSVTLDVPATAGTFTVNLPAANGDVVVTGGGSTVQFGAGSVSAPSITFSGDTNTGLYSPAADTIAFTEGGVEAMRITAVGSVGIGTASPTSKLEVLGGTIRHTLGGGGPQLLLGNSNNTVAVGSVEVSGDAALAFYTSTSSERMRIDSAGNVGIGTASPNARLDVNGTVRAGTAGGVSLSIASNSAIRDTTNGGSTMYFDVSTGGASHGAFDFRSSNAFTSRMYISDAGNVGIGTSSPLARLHVRATTNQNLHVTSAINVPNAIVIAGVNDANNANIPIEMRYTSNFVFVDAGTERARINANSQFLIGTSSAFGGGGFGTNRLQVESDGTPLYLRHSTAGGGNFWRVGPDGSGNNFVVYNQNGNGVYIVNNGTGWISTSDERRKTDLKPIESAAQKVSALRAVTGRFKTDEPGISRAFLIAQDVQAVLPEAVSVQDDEQGTLGLAYTDVIPLLTAALQEALSRIETLEARLAAVEAR